MSGVKEVQNYTTDLMWRVHSPGTFQKEPLDDREKSRVRTDAERESQRN
jgi:hypothetical protein